MEVNPVRNAAPRGVDQGNTSAPVSKPCVTTPARLGSRVESTSYGGKEAGRQRAAALLEEAR